MIPKRWIMIERGGKAEPAREALAFSMRKIIDERLLPFVRQRMDCLGCIVCSSIVRRYFTNVVGERYRDPPHTDGQAYATIVVALDTAGQDYTGGLYVVTDPSRPHFVALRAGEAVVHSWDLQHGVQVDSGKRVSWIMWVQDSDPCVKQPEFHQRQFFKQAAVTGNVVAMHILGSNPAIATQESRQWLQRAAEAGFPRAMGLLGASLQITDKQGAAKWLGRAAAKGDVTAQADLGMLHLRLGNLQQAETWLRRAAENGNAIAQHDLGMALYTSSFGRPRDYVEATKWFKAAAKQGHAQAESNLGTCYAEGRGVPKSLAAALYWWREAATQGVSEAWANIESLQNKHRGWKSWPPSTGD